MSGSSHHSLSIDGPESKMVAELEASSICCQVIDSQYVRIGGVGYQILYISPRQLRTENNNFKNFSLSLSQTAAHLAWSVRAIMPDIKGAEADVPVKWLEQPPLTVVVRT